ncbi:HPr family phosphocarrier protein [Malacoplasma penetrans]|uniref:Phosphocarrier protein HPr n=1 Tax=Malacoplasma penetrans (strain HF-2) TaxID=272633 RepID=Q8EWC4_MALP2|nr:HPr family phosphocarrier protein [Malacoplasma penetrans]RXY96765.1 HPr family phosphocarrier protein [Malacoplasma penetrans]BAC44072.1 phosphocarrier HPr protein [Malacoplasma penetrans HF-2]
MKSINVTIIDPIGIHARPASMISSTAAKFQSSVTFKNGEKSANAKSVINLMALSAKQGNSIEIAVDGADEDAAIEAIKKVMEEEKLI